MYRLKTVLKIALLSLGLFFAFSAHVSAEVIRSFDAQITVNTDNSVSVVETILYDSEGLQKHGIYRDITPRSSEGKTMSINSISVVDSAGRPYQWHREINNGDVRLKIGDPGSMFTGVKTYVISYVATNAVAHLDNADEIYWNVTGNAWPFVIEKASATVMLPERVVSTQIACYQGANGTTEECSTEGYIFRSTRAFNPGEGMTIATGFPSDIVVLYVPQSFFEKYGVYIISLLIPILVFLGMYRRWRKVGKDPKESGIIVPQYDAPDNLTPMEAAVIVYEGSRNKDFSAEIIYLATKDFITIEPIEKKIAGFISLPNDYRVILLKDPNEATNDFDKKLLTALFPVIGVGESLLLSSVKYYFYASVTDIYSSVRESVIQKGYYRYLPNPKKKPIFLMFFNILFILAFWATIQALLQNNLLLSSYSEKLLVAMIVSFIVSIGIYIFFDRLMPSKTEKGIALKEYLLGLKLYLQIAEKDRINFHNAPEKKPEVFEILLPFAMVFGVEKAWAKEFADIYTTPPQWYRSTNPTSFTSVSFVNNLSSFRSATQTGTSGGSSGGGFSGGGGGGGGGGTW